MTCPHRLHFDVSYEPECPRCLEEKKHASDLSQARDHLLLAVARTLANTNTADKPLNEALSAFERLLR